MHYFDGFLDAAETGKNDRGGAVSAGFHVAKKLKPVHAWHHEVGKDYIRRIFRMNFQRFLPPHAVAALKPKEEIISATIDRWRGSSSTTRTLVGTESFNICT